MYVHYFYLLEYIFKHIYLNIYNIMGASLVAQMVKKLLSIWSLNQEDPLEEEMATYPSILAWTIPRTEETRRLQSMGSQRVRCDWGTNTFTFIQHNTWGALGALIKLFLDLGAGYIGVLRLWKCIRPKFIWCALRVVSFSVKMGIIIKIVYFRNLLNKV